MYYHFSGDDQLVNNRHYYRHLCIRTTVITPKAQGRGDKMTLMRVQEVSQSVSSGTFELVVRCSVYNNTYCTITVHTSVTGTIASYKEVRGVCLCVYGTVPYHR